MPCHSRFAAAGCALLFSGLLAQAQQPSPEMVVQTAGKEAGAVRFGGQGRWIVTASRDRRLTIYDVPSGRLSRVITLPASDMPSYAAPQIAAHPREDRVAVAVAPGQVAVFDVRTGGELWRTSAAGSWQTGGPLLNALEYSEDGGRLFGLFTVPLASQNAKPGQFSTVLKTWNAADGTETSAVPVLDGAYGTGFSIDGAWVYGVKQDESDNRRSLIADRATGRPAGPVIDGFVMAAHSRSGRALVVRGAGPNGGTIALVDVRTGKTVAAWPGYGGVFSPRGDRFLVADLKANWTVVDTQTAQMVFPGDPALPAGISWAIAADSDTVAIPQADAVALIPASAPGRRRMLGNQAAPLISGELMRAASQGGDEAARAAREIGAKFGSPTTMRPTALFTPDGRWLVVRAADGQLDVWDAATGNRMPFRIPSNLESKQPLYAGEDGRSLWVRSDSSQDMKMVKVRFPGGKVETASMQESFTAQRVDVPAGRVVSQTKMAGFFTCTSPDGRYVVETVNAGKRNASAGLRSTADGRMVADLTALGVDLLAGCSISPDGNRVVVGRSAQKSKHRVAASNTNMPMMKTLGVAMMGGVVLRVLDLGEKRVTAELNDSSGRPGVFNFGASGVRWSADGKYVAAGGGEAGSFAATFMPDGPIRVWEVATGRQICVLPDASRNAVPLGFTPDGANLIATDSLLQPDTEGYGVEVWNLRTAAAVAAIGDAMAAPDAVILTPNGKVFAAPDRDGALSFWDRASGKLLGQLRAMQEGEWLVTSPSGAFDGSPRGWTQIAWRNAGLKETASGELFFNEFFRPGLLADLIEGRSPQVSKRIADLDRRQPSIKLDGAATGSRTALVKIDVTEAPAAGSQTSGSGVRDVRLFRNGVLVKAWRGDLALAGGSAHLETTVTLTSGANRLAAYAFNHDNIRSPDGSLTLVNSAPPRKATTYVLAIGINEYANREFNLQYAVPDAKALAEELGRAQKALGQTDSVQIVELLNADATRANILFALDRLSSRPGAVPPAGAPPALAALGPAQPEDTVIIYYAGHGLAAGDRFHLIPHDLGYAGPRSGLRAALDSVLAHSISDRDLERAVEPIDARHLLLIIDACQSGRAIQSDEERRGPMNSRGLAQLAYEKGMSILTASQAYQAALESSRLGHGYLTFALVEEGLKTPAADSAPADGQITAAEWFEFAARRVPEMQIAALEQARHQGRLLTFEPGATDAGQSRLQTPRFFSKRDTSAPPLIVAKPEGRLNQ